jgi:hypothetical protein
LSTFRLSTIMTTTIIRLQDCQHNVIREFYIETFQKMVMFCSVHDSSMKLLVKKDRQVSFERCSFPGPNNMFNMQIIDQCRRIVEIRHNQKASKTEKGLDVLFLGIDQEGRHIVLSHQEREREMIYSTRYYFSLHQQSYPPSSEIDFFDSFLRVQALEHVFASSPKRFQLSQWQLRRFISEGYLILPGIVPQYKVSQCLRRLFNQLGQPQGVVAGGIQTQLPLSAQGLVGEGERERGAEGYEPLGKLDGHASNCREVRALFEGEVEAVARALLRHETSQNLSAQLALRFPEMLYGSRLSKRIYSTLSSTLCYAVPFGFIIRVHAKTLARTYLESTIFPNKREISWK